MIAIRETIRELGASRLARASGLPLTTICRWRDEDRIPGKGPAHDWRVRQLEQAALAVREARAGTTPSGDCR